MNILCNSKIVCPPDQLDIPITGIGSEEPDKLRFFAINTGTWETYQPPLGSNWTSNYCLGVCVSEISQEDADLCAAREQVNCSNTGDHWTTPPDQNPPDPPGVPKDPEPSPVFTNTAQSCSFTCPDGLLFTWTIAAGTFSASSQAAADAQAHSYACKKAGENYICLSAMSGTCCVGSSITKVIVANRAATFSVVAGSLPPNTSLVQLSANSAAVTGFPSTGGSYSFTIRATDAGGNFIQKTYTLGVLDISNADIAPDASIGDAYSFQLFGTGGTAPYLFALLGGSLPDGLTLDAGGLISGTTTGTPGVFSAVVSITDAGGTSCQNTITINAVSNLCFSSPEVLPNGITCGAAYSYFLQVDPGIVPDPGFALCYQVTAGALPPGLNLDFNTGEISGSPTTPGQYDFTVCLCQN